MGILTLHNIDWIRLNNLILTLVTLTYPLELILQDTGDVEAEVGAKCQQTVEEQHHKAIICCKKERMGIIRLGSLAF